MNKQQIFDLAAKAASGSEEAFEIILNEKAQHILYSAYDILKNHHDAEDAAQDVVVKMYKYIGNLKESENFNAWLQKIIHNVCITKLRKSKYYKNDLDVETIMDTTFGESLTEKDREFLPHAFAEDESLSKTLLDVIKELPKKRRRAILMYYYEDMSQNEIAQVMEISEATVASNILRAKNDIKAKLESRTGMNIDDKMQSQTANFAAVPVLGQVFTADAAVQFGPESIAHLVNFGFKGVADASPKHLHNPSNLGIKVAAIVTTAGVICSGAFIAISEPVSVEPDVAMPTTIEQPSDQSGTALSEDGKIIFTGGDCDCGHKNPRQIVLEYDESKVAGELQYKWEIVGGSNGIVAEGSDKTVDVPGGMSTGDYTARYTLADKNENILIIERDFVVQ